MFNLNTQEILLLAFLGGGFIAVVLVILFVLRQHGHTANLKLQETPSHPSDRR